MIDWHTWAVKLFSATVWVLEAPTETADTIATDVTAGITRVNVASAGGTVGDNVCDGDVDSGVVGAVGGAMVPLLGVADVEVVEIAGAVAACESLGTTPVVISALLDGALAFATGKNSHIAS